MGPKTKRWIERVVLVTVTAVLVYKYGPTVAWYLTDSTDHHLGFYYGSRP